MSNTNPNYGHSKILSNLIHAMNHSSSSHAMTSSNAGNGASMVACSSSTCDRQSPLLQGYLYKIHKRNGKTQKYFVIFDDVPDKPGTGRLEYFDSEKKFKSAMAKSKTGGITNEKRSIILCTCFNINRRFDTKYRNVIGLYRKDDTFSIMAKDESECNTWLKQMLILQRGKESVDADQPRPTFEHVWEVDIIRRGLGDSYGIVGPYRVCITDTTLSLVRIGPPTTSVGTNRPDKVDFALAHMRRCGSTQSVFYLEVGRFTSTGAGEIWMETYDPMIAENMNTIILNTAQKKANSHRTEENLGPMMRIRSQSANETSKPVNHRRSTLTGKPNFSPSGSSASTRERCDSFPLTRIRTTSDTTPTHSQTPQQNGNYANNNNNTINNNISMPPPRRPVSMSYASQRYGNSPPNNSSPISPPSCSESDASSASIDETDGFIHSMTLEEHGNLRDYQNSFSIPEENESNWHKWNNNISLNHNQRKESPIPPHEAYVDMHPYSPYSCSPGDPSHNAYMPMSPGDYRSGMYVNSGAHSRASSLAEDNEGYVPMHPATNHDSYLQMSQHPEDYMNMQPTSNHMSIHGGELSSATSSCSITSGTPSTDIRFSEYHLDKVQARFTPSEDDELLDRPPRTYSVGSKLEHTKRKLHIDRVAAEHSNLRHRAYSVGSRNIKVSRAELTSHSGSHTPSSHNSPVAMNHHEINNNTSGNNNNAKNKKSSSAPLLANVLGKTGHGSFEQMDDLMEIDFSSQSSGSSLTRVNTSSTPIKSSPVNIPSKPNDNYMNMSGRQSNKSSCSAGMSPYVDMKPSAIRRVSENNDYMDMNPASSTTLRTSNTSTSLSSSPLKALTTPTASAPRSVPATSNSTGSTNNNNNNNNSNSNYMDMSPRSYDISSRNNHRNSRMTSSVTSLSSQKLPSDDYLNMSPVNKSLPDVDLPKRSSVPDGYMEMSWTKSNKKTQSATRNNANDNPSSSSDEYINMDYSNNNDGAGTSDSSSSAKDRSISLPITINKRYSSSTRSQKSSKAGSIENGPPAFLPLAGNNQITASVSPTRTTNISRTRCDSRDSGIVGTPSGSQATIFPFSPGSPMKQFDPIDDTNLPRKCLVDGSTGTIKLSEDDIIEEEPRTPVPMGMTTTNNSEKQLDTLSNDYAVMNLGEPVSKKPNLAATPVQIKSSSSSASSSLSANATSHFLLSPDSENHDYINCMPNAHINSSQKIVTPTPIIPQHNNNNNNTSVEAGDYALMNPVKAASSPIAKQMQQQSDCDIPPVTSSKKSLLLSLSSHEKLNTSNSCFKPIVEDTDLNPLRNHPLLQRHVSEKGHRQSSNDSGYEILARPSLSRPNSVNSEKIKCSTSGFLSNRPNSANSERLALSSTSSSTSTLCEIQSQCSSSSTLKNIMMDTTSGVPSPMSIISRPESVSSDVHMTSRPPSVTSERELHYASLDLPPCSNTNPIHLAQQQQQKMDVDDTSGSKMDFTTSSSPQTSSSSSSSASSQQSQPAFTYAQIDFVKSESLKAQQQQTNNNSNNNQSGSKK
ncbi:insulin receptor substrate 1-like isoform X6 [Chironomus tepperi]|uniref:insulin receptor substrate 1-like isoform X6 n=1 Tax=Chironomus tepperi TaxID=113505 RepID=UPI00391F6896